MSKASPFAFLNEQSSLRSLIGFACNQGFIFSMFYFGQNRAVDFGSVSFERIDLFCSLVFMVAAFALFRTASPKARDAALSRPLLMCYSLLMVIGSLFPHLGGQTIAAYAIEGALVGIPSSLMLAAWGRALGSRPEKEAVAEVFLAAALGAALCLIVGVLSFSGAAIVLCLLPLGSAYALRQLAPFVSAKTTPDEAKPTQTADEPRDSEEGAEDKAAASLKLADFISTREQRAETKRISMKIVAGTLLFGLSGGLMETFVSDPGDAAMPAFLMSLVVLLLFSVAALQLLFGAIMSKSNDGAGKAESGEAEEGGPLDNVYRLALLVCMAGYLFVPVLGEYGVPGESIVLAGFLGLEFVLISLFLVTARISETDTALSFARGFAALFAGEAVGVVLGNAVESSQPFVHLHPVLSAAAGLVTLFAYLFLFTERDFRALSVIVRSVDRFEEQCARIVKRFGLSKREADVLPLALRGRTNERIAEELTVSKSTIDTHLRRIYQKTGVGGRQELIDLSERC